MNAKLLWSGVSIGLLLGLALLRPAPHDYRGIRNEMLFANPAAIRTLSGFAAPLLADWLWLASNDISETGVGDSYAVDTTLLIDATKTIAALDPHFIYPTTYAATYLTSVRGVYEPAFALYDEAWHANPDNFRLGYLYMVSLTTYGSEGHSDRVAQIAAKLNAMPESEQLIGAMRMGEWITQTLVYARQKEGRTAQAKEDLAWLLRTTQNPQRRAQIRQALQTLLRTSH